MSAEAYAGRVRWAPAAGLVLLAPLCAEYVTGYLEITGDPVELAAGLLILAPLYGAPALLIRELARRFGVRWPGIIALAAALAVVQAGVIDQSLFSEGYQGYEGWNEQRQGTLIVPLGISASHALNFIPGHVIWSFAIPIALAEALAGPGLLARRPWLRTPGLIVTALLYAAAAWLIRHDQLANERDHASPAQVAACLVVIALLVSAAFTVGRRERPRVERAVPAPTVIGLASLAAALAYNLLPETWPGAAAGLVMLAAATAGVAAMSRSTRWSTRHLVALATGALLARAIIGFLAEPFGDVPEFAKYAHNVAFLAGTAALGAWAWRRSRPEVRPPVWRSRRRAAARAARPAGRTRRGSARTPRPGDPDRDGRPRPPPDRR